MVCVKRMVLKELLHNSLNLLARGGVSVGAVGAIAPTVSEEIPIGA